MSWLKCYFTLLTGHPEAGFLFHPYRKPKRVRTAFSPSQLLKLEHAFEKNHYVVGQERKELASKLNLTETQVTLRAHIEMDIVVSLLYRINF